MESWKSKFKINPKFLLIILSFVFCVSIPLNEASAAGASLYLSPSSGTYTVGSTFSVKVKVNSGGEPINAAEGTLIFNPSEINVTSISKSGSIFSLWTTDPSFSNSTGNIVFGGGTPSGFTGTSGTIIKIIFKAKASGSTRIDFSSGSILAADGKGTNILGSMNRGVYTLKSKVVSPPPSSGTPPETEDTPPTTPEKPPVDSVILPPVEEEQKVEKPIITDLPQSINLGEILKIKGTSAYPESAVIIFIQKQGEEAESQIIQTDKQGNWLLVYDRDLEKGNYKIWAQSVDENEIKSEPTEKFDLNITLPAMLKFGTIAISYLIIMATLIVLIVICTGVIFYAWYRISLWRKRLSKETKEVSQTVAKSFHVLREKVQEQVERLDKKPGLTKEEKVVRGNLQEALDIAEKFIDKEVKDIKKELK